MIMTNIAKFSSKWTAKGWLNPPPIMDLQMIFHNHGYVNHGYHLVMTNIAMENPNHKWRFLAGKIIYFYGLFSMAMLNSQRVYVFRYADEIKVY